MRYQVNVPVMVLAYRDNHFAAVSITAGEIFEVVSVADDDRFLVVEVKGQQFLIFESDLREWGRPVDGIEAQIAA